MTGRKSGSKSGTWHTDQEEKGENLSRCGTIKDWILHLTILIAQSMLVMLIISCTILYFLETQNFLSNTSECLGSAKLSFYLEKYGLARKLWKPALISQNILSPEEKTRIEEEGSVQAVCQESEKVWHKWLNLKHNIPCQESEPEAKEEVAHSTKSKGDMFVYSARKGLDGKEILGRAVNLVRQLFDRFVNIFKKMKGREKTRHSAGGSACTPHYESYKGAQKKLIKELAFRMRNYVNDTNFDDRVKAVSWGGKKGTEWWTSKNGGGGIDGLVLLGNYLKVMNWDKDLQSKFPFKLCPNQCPSEFALAHTLEYREKFKPWLVTPSVVKENQVGWIYHHGHSPQNSPSEVGPSIVWFRPGIHAYRDSEAYLRTIVTALDFAVMDSLQRSQNQMGKYNLVLDAADFKVSLVPQFGEIKRLFRILSDHNPNRLGHIIVVNLTLTGHLFIKTALFLVPKDVQKKIHILSNENSSEGIEMLEMCIGSTFIPQWLGGKSRFQFRAETYYSKSLRGSDEEGKRYLTTMPYHA